MHDQQSLKKQHYCTSIYRKYELEKRHCQINKESIKSGTCYKVCLVPKRFVLGSNTKLQNSKIFHAFVVVLLITEFGIKESHGRFKFTKTGNEF